MKNGLDLSKFKKVRETETHAVLEHPEGHQIHIAKGKLSKAMRDKLGKLSTKEGMAEGGQVPNEKENYDSNKKQMLGEFSQRQAFAEKNFGSPFAKSDNAEWADPKAGALRKMDAGLRERWPELYSKTHMDPSNHAESVSYDHPGKTDWGAKKKDSPPKMAEGGIMPPSPPGNIMPSSYDQVQADALQNGNPSGGFGGRPLPIPPAATGPDGAPRMSAADQPGMPSNPTIDFRGIQQATGGGGLGVNSPGIQDAMGDYMRSLQHAYGQQEAGIRMQAQKEGELGRHEAEAMAADQSMKLMIKDNYQNQFQELNGHINSAIEDVNNGHIDPDHYMSSKSDWGKARTAIGLILGGIGSGLTGQPNAALDFINKQIDRDILTQRVNLDKKNTVLGAYMRQMGNLGDATKMAWAFYNDLYTSELKKQAALMRDPLARAQAMQLVGEREQQKAQVLGPLAFQRAMMQTMGSGQVNPAAAVRMYSQMGLIKPEYAEKAMQELTFAENHSKQSQIILDTFDKAVKENTLGNRVMHAGYEPASIGMLKTAVMPYLKTAEGQINETEIERMDELLPRPGDSAKKIADKRQGWVNFLAEKAATPHLKGLGMAPGHVGQTMAKPNSNAIPGYNGGR